MFDYTYDFEPATEGLGDFFTTVLNKIKESGKKIKEWIEKVARRIRQMTGTTSADEVKEDSKEALNKIDDIGKNIEEILADCKTSIEHLFATYHKYGAYKVVSDDELIESGVKKSKNRWSFNNASREIIERDGENRDYTSSFNERGGMGHLRKDLTDTEKKEWAEEQQKVALGLKDAYGKAEKVKDDLKSLSKFGPLSKSATQKGYDRLRGIFNANGAFGAQWKQVKAAAEWSTGKIREAFNKVVSVYDVGIRATDAFGKRLVSGFFRDEKGEKMDKSDRKEIMKSARYEQGVNKSYGKTTNTIKTGDDTRIGTMRGSTYDGSGKNHTFRRELAGKYEDVTKESVILDRLYQMAYQDAMEDIVAREEAMEFYDSIPGAYEFVEEGYDPDFDYDLV